MRKTLAILAAGAVLSSTLLEGVAVGNHVRFRFQETGSAHMIDEIVKQ